MGGFFASGARIRESASHPLTNTGEPGKQLMNEHLKSYAWFLGFIVITKIVVAPVARQMNIPVLSDALA